VVLFLDADDALARAHQLHGHLHAAQEGLGVVVQQFLVFMEQGSHSAALAMRIEAWVLNLTAWESRRRRRRRFPARQCARGRGEAAGLSPGNARSWRHIWFYLKIRQIAIDSGE
jgi:hypothetical protein